MELEEILEKQIKFVSNSDIESLINLYTNDNIKKLEMKESINFHVAQTQALVEVIKVLYSKLTALEYLNEIRK